MKKASKFVFRLMLAITVASFVFQASSCGGDENPTPDPDPDPTPTPQEIATEILTTGTWEPQAITREGIDVSAEYAEFTVKFTGSNYTTTNGGSAWPASGTWAFDGTSATRIIRDGSVIIETSISEGSLVMAFTLDEEVFARTKTVSSNYQFSMAQ